MASAQQPLSGVFWETMLGLNSVYLLKRLEACAEKDLHWALDQARCLAHHTERDSRRFSAIGEFAAKKLDSIQPQDTGSKITALELISGCLPPTDARSKKAAPKLRAELERIYKTSPKSALEKAALTGTSLLASDDMRAAAANFIVLHTDPAEPTYLRHLAVSANRATLEKILTQIDTLGRTEPLKALIAIDILLEYGRYLSGEQSFRASQKREALEKQGGFLARHGMLIVSVHTTDNYMDAIAEKPREQVLH